MDVLFTGGTVFTAEAAAPEPDAVFVSEGRIAALGGEAVAQARASRDVEAIDLAGRMLLPGFQDAHAHPPAAGLVMQRCSLTDLRGVNAYLEAIGRYAQENPDTAWVVGGGWAMDAFPGGIASRHDLDRIVPDRPVYLVNRDGHGAWVNSRALEIGGIGRDTPDPPDGRIERDSAGDPVGTLQEGAMGLLTPVLPETTVDEVVSAIVAAQDHLISIGVTSWQDAWVTPVEEAAYRSLAERQELKCRVIGALWWERDRGLEQIEDLVLRRDRGPVGRFNPSSVKLMLDGVCENFTAALLEPYLDRHGLPTDNSGIEFLPAEVLEAAVVRLDDLGFQVHFHALGDRAVRRALDAIAAARATNGRRNGRHHLAHIQVVHPSDVGRFAELGAVANAQPLWARLDGYQRDLTIPFLGSQRALFQYPFRTLVESGATLAIGSDWPVSTADPFEILHTAVHRSGPSAGSEPLNRREALDRATALRAYTAGSAFVNHLDAISGTIAAGKSADLIVVDRDLLTTDDIGHARVDLTMIAGEILYTR